MCVSIWRGKALHVSVRMPLPKFDEIFVLRKFESYVRGSATIGQHSLEQAPQTSGYGHDVGKLAFRLRRSGA